MEKTVVQGQPSWKLTSDRVEAYLTEVGGHLGPMSFDVGGRWIQPFNVAPWAEEAFDPELPAILRVLRGDFFCMPFGGNDVAFRGEAYPAHGETANAAWSFESISGDERAHTLHASLETTVRRGRVDKFVTLRTGQSAVYQRHLVSEMSGPMSFGHHAMLRFPDRQASGLVSTSPFVVGRTAPEPVELPENRGYSILKPDAEFRSLDGVPTITGSMADLSRYPARRGFEDLVMLVSDAARPFAWTAVAFPSEGYVWLALKDPRVLRQTIFWISNAGRHYAPWSGRHFGVMGLEEVTSYFHYGLAESAADNPISALGHPTVRQLGDGDELDVRYIMAVAPIRSDFGSVVEVSAAGEGVSVIGSSGEQVSLEVDLSFLVGQTT